MDRKNAIIAALCILLVLAVSSSYLIYEQQQRTIEHLGELIGEKGGVTKEYVSEDNYTAVSESQSQGNSESNSNSSANIVAVRSDSGLGVIGKVRVEIREGSGRVLVNTNPFIEPTTQYSVREAVKVAENFTGVDRNTLDNDVVISFDINGTLIGGPSAGAAVTTATIAAITGKKVRDDVAITGTIKEDGSIGWVGGVFEKAVAAEKNNMSLFLVPKGQKNLTYYEKEIEEQNIFGFTFVKVYYTPKEIDLGKYMEGMMGVEEVSTISDAVGYMVIDK
jgi:uncharacterized protein